MDDRALLRAAVLSGLPSTTWSILRGDDPLAATRAAGALLLPDEQRPVRLAGAGLLVHLAVSAGWLFVMDAALPERRRVAWGAAAGLVIAALDLGLAHACAAPRFAAIRRLPVGPQVLDHVAFGVAATWPHPR